MMTTEIPAVLMIAMTAMIMEKTVKTEKNECNDGKNDYNSKFKSSTGYEHGWSCDQIM